MGGVPGGFAHQKLGRGRNVSPLAGIWAHFVISERGWWQVFLLDCPCSWGCCGRWRKWPGVGFGASGSLGRCCWCLAVAPQSLESPQSLSFPQQPKHFSIPARQRKIHVAALTATARGGSGANPPFLSASKAACGSLSFLPAAPFLQSQFDLIRMFQQGVGTCIPLRHLSTGLEVLLHPHTPAAASRISTVPF